MSEEQAAQTAEETIVLQFNGCINRRDLDGLAALMAEEHTFVDSAEQQLGSRVHSTLMGRLRRHVDT